MKTITFDVAIERARSRLQAHYVPDHWRGLDFGAMTLDCAASACALLAGYATDFEEAPPGELDSLRRQVSECMDALGWPVPVEAAQAFAVLVCGDAEPS